MTKREIKRTILLSVASELEGHVLSGAGYLYSGFDPEDWPKATAAIYEIADELRRRGTREST